MSRAFGILRWRTVVALLTCLFVLTSLAACAADKQPQAFTFVVMGDNQPARADSAPPDIFKKMLKDIDALNPAFVVNTGDWIYGSGDTKRLKEQHAEFTSTVKSILKPRMYLTVGNHEVRGKMHEEYFRKELGKLYYSFDHGDSHFIVLDSEVQGEVGRIAGEQLKWLQDDLNKSRAARHKFVFVHRPLYPVDGQMGRSLDQYPKDRDLLHNLFVRNRINTVFSGHEHLFNVQTKNTVRYIITGGGGAFVFPSVLGTGDFHHYTVVKVSGDKVEITIVKPAENGKPGENVPVGNGSQSQS